jgi:hypothetical protein
MHIYKNSLFFTLSLNMLAFHATTNCAAPSTSNDETAIKKALNQIIVSTIKTGPSLEQLVHARRAALDQSIVSAGQQIEASAVKDNKEVDAKEFVSAAKTGNACERRKLRRQNKKPEQAHASSATK